MKKYKLKNGITVIQEKNSSRTVAIEVMLKVGSNDESPKEAGLSHFLEHMLFEGTKKRKTGREIANEIEQYGAEFNAYTTGDRTAYYIKIINKHLDKALDILSDMILHSVFEPRSIKKERDVILKEINMVTDDPRQHQWIIFQQALFKKHQARNPTYGTVKAVKSFDRNTIVNYYKKHYVPANMIISVVGNADNIKTKLEKYFGSAKKRSAPKRTRKKEPQQRSTTIKKEKRKINNSYMVLGYKTVPRIHKDSYVFDVINGILGRGQSGWMFDEIRNKRGLAYQVGLQVDHEMDHGYLAVYSGLNKKYLPTAKKIMLEQFKRLEKLTKKELQESKTFIEGNHTVQMEDNFHKADELSTMESIKDAELSDSYFKNIKKVTLRDVRRAAKKYLNKNYTLAVVEQK